jgi:hypothetical protein
VPRDRSVYTCADGSHCGTALGTSSGPSNFERSGTLTGSGR